VKTPPFICLVACLLASARAGDAPAPKPGEGNFIERFEALPAERRPEEAVKIAASLESKSPGMGLAWAGTLQVPELRAKALDGVVCGSTLEKPAALVKMIVELPVVLRTGPGTELFGKLADIDIERAFDEALAVSDPQFASWMISEILNRWDRLRPLPVEKLNKLSDPHFASVRAQIIRSVAEKMAGEDATEFPEDIFEHLKDPVDRNMFLGTFANRLCNTKPRLALALLKRVPAADRRTEDISQVCGAVANEAPVEALATAEEGKGGAPSTAAAESTCRKVAAAYPEVAAEWLANHRSLPGYRDLLTRLGTGWQEMDAQVALNWAATLETADRVAVIAAMATQAKPFYPPQAANKLGPLVSLRPDDNFLADDCRFVVNAWAQSDPTGAAAWLGTLVPGKISERAAAPLFERWCKDSGDLAPCVRWIESLPAGDRRDRIIPAFATCAANYDPALAFKYASAVPSSAAADSALVVSANAWLKSDPEAARKAIETSNLAPKKKAELLGNNSLLPGSFRYH